MKKLYVLDTNVLLSDPSSIFSFQENDLIIPMAVIEELDKHKSRQDEVGKNARQVNRMLDDMRKLGSLVMGVNLPSGAVLKVVSVNEEALKNLPFELRTVKVDNLIIAFMMQLRNSTDVEHYDSIVLVSKDINVRIKCDSVGVKCEDYLKMRVAADPQKFYRGVEVVEVTNELVDEFYANGELDASRVGSKFQPNEIVVLKHIREGNSSKSAMTRLVGNKLVALAKIENAFGLKPKNKEQQFSLDLLFDDSVKLLTLVGPAGTGKTIISLAAALQQLKGLGHDDSARYEKLIVMRPVQPIGKDIGFLPGTLEEKMEPWVAPIRDNLDFLVNRRQAPKRRGPMHTGRHERVDERTYLTMMQERGLIEVEAITFIRGRSIPNAFIIIDEAQNLSIHELKTIVTRVGENTKIVLTGDLEQIDNVHVDVYTNGLTYAIESFKTHAIAGHVTLLKGERSALATIAASIL